MMPLSQRLHCVEGSSRRQLCLIRQREAAYFWLLVLAQRALVPHMDVELRQFLLMINLRSKSYRVVHRLFVKCLEIVQRTRVRHIVHAQLEDLDMWIRLLVWHWRLEVSTCRHCWRALGLEFVCFRRNC